MNVDKFQLDKKKAFLVVVDIQERLVPSMDPAVYGQVRGNVEFLLQAAAELGVPVVATEQYPRGLGHTVGELQEACVGGAVEKVSFGCCGEPAFLERLKALGRTQALITGMEAHVCVYQTVLGLLESGYHVHLVRDAICSRGEVDYGNTLELASTAGAVVTTAETAVFQMLQQAGTAEFKAISTLIKER